MLGCKKGRTWAKKYCHEFCPRCLHYSHEFKQCQIGMKGIYFCALILIAFGTPNITFALAPCDYYASPSRLGNGLTETTPFKIADFWSVAGPGKTLCLLDGIYTGGSSMIAPPENLSGVQGNPITVRAFNDGKATLNGEGAREPVKLKYNNWFVLEGFNAHDSSGYVLKLSRSDHNIVRRVVGWNASIDGNTHVFGAPYSKYPLFEDVAGFGTGRKIFETFKTTDAIIRRAWGRWEGSTITGPKQSFAPVYNGYGTMIENAIATWTGEEMTKTPNQPFGIISTDRIDFEDRKSRLKLFGNIMHVTGEGTFHPPQQLFIRKLDDIQIKDLVAYFPQGQYASKRSVFLDDCWKADSGSILCTNPQLSITNLTSIGGAGPYITSHWETTNLISSPSVSSLYSPGENLFVNSGNVGATICKRYVDGVLTQDSLWPWPMDQRIHDALQQAGKTPFYVTDIIESMFGTIPSECKQSPGGEVNEPPTPPSGFRLN